jgi:hypothetical protein
MRRVGGTWEVSSDAKRKPISVIHEREISMHLKMADHLVVALKRL